MSPTPTTATGSAVAPATAEHEGYHRFVRANTHTDRFHALSFHHVDLWCATAASAVGRFSFVLGTPLAAQSDLSTGNSTHASLLLRSGSVALLFTAPYARHLADAATTSVPSFSAGAARSFVAEHGLPVHAVAVRVADAFEAFGASVDAGARPAFAPTDLGRGFGLAEVKLYGDVVLHFVSYPDNTSALFLPVFENMSNSSALGYGLWRFDHLVDNIPELAPVAAYIAGFTGFHEFAEFTAEDVGTAESELKSMVLANNSETVLLPFNEPVHDTMRRSEIQTYLDHHGGPGVQHIVLACDDMVWTLREMRARSAMGGFKFLAPPPPNYYDGVRRRAGDVLFAVQIKECQELGVLVDRDDQGVVLEIFTKPVRDRKKCQMIQRIGCVEKDESGKEYQRGGCGGFGKGNFSELFKSIEEYEKSHEAQQVAAAQES